ERGVSPDAGGERGSHYSLLRQSSRAIHIIVRNMYFRRPDVCTTARWNPGSQFQYGRNDLPPACPSNAWPVAGSRYRQETAGGNSPVADPTFPKLKGEIR